ncbi:hypothetical protein ACGFXC_22860 [Streptomyces sp. NPDC048507]|uniref:hypothetical protein n=1 Tax=Streptomyces sp. NPDC048507 TaxID=3365560 RepID=UPI00371B6FAD
MSKEQKHDVHGAIAKATEQLQLPHTPGHGFEGPVRSKVKGGAHTKAALKRSGTPRATASANAPAASADAPRQPPRPPPLPSAVDVKGHLLNQ